ncbi:MAG: glycosyltransferase [Alphaproteobacteria bacterium]|nr:glycosyltransferase [Alphaproteobacteria bacterium]
MTDRPAKCLLVARNFPPVIGGSAVVYDQLAANAQGMIVVLSGRNDIETGRPLEGWGRFDAGRTYTVHRTAWLRPRERGGRRTLLSPVAALVRDYWTRLRVALRVIGLCAQYRIRVICIGELISLGWLASLCRLIPGLHAICFVHGEEITTEFGFRRFARDRARSLRHADAVVAVSSYTRHRLQELMKVPPAKVEVINNGVDLARFRPVPYPAELAARLGAAGRRVILTVSRLMQKKGIDSTLYALPALVEEWPSLLYLVVGEGEYRTQLESIARELALDEHVVFCGAVQGEALADYYALAEFFVMPNRRMPDGDTEGFGLVFLEANACRKAVIGGRDGGVPDAVVDGETGILVNGQSIDDLRAAMRALLADDTLRDRLAEGGYRRALESGWASRARKFLALVELTERGGSR